MSYLVAPISKTYPIPAAGVTVPAGREFAVNATVAGNVVVHFSGDPASQQHTIGVLVGYSVFPYSIDSVVSMTATATLTNLGVSGG